MDTDPRTLALALARGRVVIGCALLVAPGLVLRNWLREPSAGARAIARMMGARDLVLGVGAITSIKEQTQDAEWLSMGALADGVDALVSLAAPGISRRGRAVALVGGGAAVSGMLLARRFADARAERAASAASEVDS